MPGGNEGEISRAERRRIARRRQRLSPITAKIITVNLLALLIPILALLYSGPYRDSLIQQELEALRAQGEIISGALGESAISQLADGQEVLNMILARDLVRRLSQASGARARFFLADGSLAVDSQRLEASGQPVMVEVLEDPVDESLFDRTIDPMLNWIGKLSDWLDTKERERYVDLRNPTIRNYVEAETALKGGAAASVRRAAEGDRLILSVALPVQRFYRVFGSLMLSREGTAIEAAMREVRLTVLLISTGTLVITVMISLYFAGTIARPLHRLAEAAERVRHTGGLDPELIPDLSRRGDEIGDLSEVLRDMTAALTNRITAIERFAADVSHEIKNPLTSLKSAIETVHRVRDPDHQKELLRIVQEDVERLDRLITDISDASRLDAELERSDLAAFDLAGMMETLVDMHQTAHSDHGATLSMRRQDNGPFAVAGIEGRLVQVFQNLIGNAETFSPPNGGIVLSIRRDRTWVVAQVDDDGPGLPPGKLEAVFDRFYSERPEHEKFGAHSGLGLSISKQIVEAHGGAIHAENRTMPDGSIVGARFVVRLPATDDAISSFI